MANSWNESGTTWGTNRWGTTNAITQGWGADAWGTGGSWGQATDEVVQLTGLSLTSAVGNPISGAEQGWGRAEWGEEPWGESFSPVVEVTGLGLTSTIGDLAYAASTTGWGSDTWGLEDWGQNATTVVPTGVSATSSVVPHRFVPQVVPDSFQELAIRISSLCYTKYCVISVSCWKLNCESSTCYSFV